MEEIQSKESTTGAIEKLVLEGAERPKGNCLAAAKEFWCCCDGSVGLLCGAEQQQGNGAQGALGTDLNTELGIAVTAAVCKPLCGHQACATPKYLGRT